MAHEADIHHENHPGPKVYVIIGAILAVLTAMEVGAFLIEVVDDHFVAGRDHVRGHGVADVAGADEANTHGDRLLGYEGRATGSRA